MRRNTITVYQDRNKKWRWRWRRSNGKVLADSGQGYVRRVDCYAGLNCVRLSSNIKVVERGKK